MKTHGLAFTLVYCLLAATVQAQAVAGWRTNGTGRYPSAAPPVKWSANGNVVWSTPLPGRGNGSPVVIAGRIFVTAEPAWLICLNAADGRILWKGENTYESILSPAEKRKMRENLAKAQPITTKLSELRKTRRQLQKQMRKAGSNRQALRGQIKDVKKAQNAAEARLAPYQKYLLPNKHPQNGYCSSTPVTDGKHVYMVFGTGVVVCYDVAGKRRWARLLEKPEHQHGHSASPVLVGDKVVVQLQKLHALKAKTGETLWEAPVRKRWGTAIVSRIGDVDVLITPSGDLVRAADGKVLASRLADVTYNSPIVHEGIAYFIQNGGKAIQLPDALNGTVKPKPLWRTTPKNDRYYASPILHEGLLYAITRKNVLSVIDAQDGKIVYSKTLDFGGKGEAYPSITLAGQALYIGNDNGTTILLKPGREYHEVGRNRLEPFRGSPVFVAGRMYVRGFTKMYCIGR